MGTGHGRHGVTTRLTPTRMVRIEPKDADCEQCRDIARYAQRLAKAAERLRRARAEVDAATEDARSAVRDHYKWTPEDCRLSEAQEAEVFGVDRMTIRDWRGKAFDAKLRRKMLTLDRQFAWEREQAEKQALDDEIAAVKAANAAKAAGSPQEPLDAPVDPSPQDGPETGV